MESNMRERYYEDYEEEEKTASSNNKYISSKDEYEIGCGFCWDKKKVKNKELYFFDAANNLRLCNFCPNCGRKYQN